MFKFLNLPNWKLKKYKKYNLSNNPRMDDKTRKNLLDFFKPYNQQLYEYLGINFNWENI